MDNLIIELIQNELGGVLKEEHFSKINVSFNHDFGTCTEYAYDVAYNGELTLDIELEDSDNVEQWHYFHYDVDVPNSEDMVSIDVEANVIEVNREQNTVKVKVIVS